MNSFTDHVEMHAHTYRIPNTNAIYLRYTTNSIVERIPVQNTNVIVERIPVQNANVIVERIPVQNTNVIVERIPAHNSNSMVEFIPTQNTNFIVERFSGLEQSFAQETQKPFYETVVSHEDMSGEEECAVCLRDIKSINRVVLTKCNHGFCGTCVENIKQHSNHVKCPLCRQVSYHAKKWKKPAGIRF